MFVTNKKKVLIIEDDESLRDNLMELMTIRGYQTQTAANGEEGLLKISAFMPDLVICDIDMPVMTGYKVLQQLRSNSAYNNIMFIFLSAHVPSGNDDFKWIAAANEYITKPISFVSLAEKIKNILS